MDEKQKMKRPLSVTIIAILLLIGGVFAVLIGFLTASIYSLLSLVDFDTSELELELEKGGFVAHEIFGSLMIYLILFVLLGVILVGVGVISIIISNGLRKGKQWAWKWGIIFAFASIGLELTFIVMNPEVSASGFSILINAVVIFVLFRPNVKEYFGKLNQ